MDSIFGDNMKMIQGFLGFIFGVLIVYGLFVFYWLEFNPSHWTPGARFLFILVAGYLGGMLAAFQTIWSKV